MKIQVSVALAVAALSAGCSTTPDFRQYAVKINSEDNRQLDEDRTPLCKGGGTYLFSGYVATAAHVMDHHLLIAPDVYLRSGEKQAAGVMAVGNREVADAAILRLDPDKLPGDLAKLPPLHVCDNDPHVGQTVAVVLDGVQREAEVEKFPDEYGGARLIVAGGHPGVSGSGVFDPEHRCLIGVVSRGVREREYTPDGKTLLAERFLGLSFAPASKIVKVSSGQYEIMKRKEYRCEDFEGEVLEERE